MLVREQLKAARLAAWAQPGSGHPPRHGGERHGPRRLWGHQSCPEERLHGFPAVLVPPGRGMGSLALLEGAAGVVAPGLGSGKRSRLSVGWIGAPEGWSLDSFSSWGEAEKWRGMEK